MAPFACELETIFTRSTTQDSLGAHTKQSFCGISFWLMCLHAVLLCCSIAICRMVPGFTSSFHASGKCRTGIACDWRCLCVASSALLCSSGLMYWAMAYAASTFVSIHYFRKRTAFFSLLLRGGEALLGVASSAFAIALSLEVLIILFF